MKKLVIAIDGPAGAGKSTVAQILAQRLEYNYIDTGAMYRAIAWKVVNSAIDIKQATAISQIANTINLRLQYLKGKTTVYVDNEDVSAAIRTPDISRVVPQVAQIASVRTAMLYLQRQMAESGGVVMDGRDIGTYVLPNADIKIFLTASIEERARRRWLELAEKGFTVNLEELMREIADRDKIDSEREIAPLVKASDAVLIDTTALSIEEAVEKISSLVRREEAVV